MDNGDITASSWERPTSQGPSWSSHSVVDFSGCSSFTSELDEELSTQTSQTYSSLLTELHKEIDRTEHFSGEGELQRILFTSMKPLLEKVFNEASQALHLSELLRPAVMRADGMAENRDQLDRTFQLHVPSLRALLLKLGFSQNLNEVESYLISSDRTCLLSKLDGLKTELTDFYQRHQSTIRTLLHSLRLAEQEKNQVRSELEKSLQPSKDQQLDSSGHAVKSLQEDLHVSEAKVRSLLEDICVSEANIQKLQEDLHVSEANVKLLQEDLNVSRSNVQSLQEDLRVSKASTQSLQDNLCISKANVQSLQKDLCFSEGNVQSLQEDLRVSEGNVQSLREDLRVSEANVQSLREDHRISEANVQKLKEDLHIAETNVKFLQEDLNISKASVQSLQQDLCISKANVQSLQENLRVSEGNVQSLREDLRVSKANAQSLGEDLRVSEGNVQSLREELRVSKANAQSLREDLRVSEGNVQSLREDLHASEGNVQSLREDLHVSEGNVQSLREDLRFSEANAQSLREDLHASEGSIQLLRQKFHRSENSLQSLKNKLKSQEDSAQVLKKTLQSVEDRAQQLLQNLQASEELSRSLELRLSGTEARVHTFQNALMAFEQCSKEDIEVLKQHEEAAKVKCKQKIRKMMKVFKSCKEKLQNSVAELQGKLVLAKEALERAKVEHSVEAKQLQHALEKVREQAEERERELHAEIIALKNKLLQESLNMNKELEKSVKYEKELQETVMDLRQVVKTQKEGRDMALECLRKRQQNVAEVQNHLEADIRQCSQTTVKEAEEQGADSYKKISVKQESNFVPLHIYPALKEKPAGTESLKVSPFALYSTIKRPLDPSQSRVLPAFFPLEHQLSETVAVPRQESAHYYYDYSTSKMKLNTEPLLSVQRRLRNLQSVHFQETIKELLRSS
ncbi:hypothetical protein SRHO_G00239770 [Serrasalmus rhombeus]